MAMAQYLSFFTLLRHMITTFSNVEQPAAAYDQEHSFVLETTKNGKCV